MVRELLLRELQTAPRREQAQARFGNLFFLGLLLFRVLFFFFLGGGGGLWGSRV